MTATPTHPGAHSHHGRPAGHGPHRDTPDGPAGRTNRYSRLLVASATALVAGVTRHARYLIANLAALLVLAVTVVLAIAAMDNLRWDPRSAAVCLLAAMFIPQYLLYAVIVHHRRTREPRR